MKNLKTLLKRSSVLFLCVALILCAAPVSSAAGESEVPFTAVLTPEKPEFSGGEEVRIRCAVKNDSPDTVTDITVFIESFGRGDDFLYKLVPAFHRDSAAGGESFDGELKLSESNELISASEKANGFFDGFLRFLLRILDFFSPFIQKFINRVKYEFGEFPGRLGSGIGKRRSGDLGTVTVTYNGRETECRIGIRYTYPDVRGRTAEKTGDAETATLKATLTAGNIFTGIVFGAKISGGDFEGLVFGLNPDGRAAVMYRENGICSLIADKHADYKIGAKLDARLDLADGRAVVYLYDDPADPDPWPVFDFDYTPAGSDVGTFGKAAAISIQEFAGSFPEGGTYRNPVRENSPDPYILFDDGVYYMYATTDSPGGFHVSTSTDLVHWSGHTRVAAKDDLIGDDWFWAPEVYKHNGRYYMFHSCNEHTAVAVADSPYGPFRAATDGYLFDFKAIDSHVFFDDDGRIYLYMSKFTDAGQQIWGCELGDELLTVKEDTLTQLTTPEGWEGSVNEGPYMLRHNGTYYLTYSGDGYTSHDYAVCIATSDKPLGKFTKSSLNPILRPNSFLAGTGHHCFTASPDGSQLFIVYHCHYSMTRVHDRKLCVDRAKFVPTENGADRLVIYGPTANAQPMPLG